MNSKTQALLDYLMTVEPMLATISEEQCPMIKYMRGGKKNGAHFWYDPYYGEHMVIRDQRDSYSRDEDGEIQECGEDITPPNWKKFVPCAIEQKDSTRGVSYRRGGTHELHNKQVKGWTRHKTYYFDALESTDHKILIVRLYEFNCNVPSFPMIKRRVNETNRLIFTHEHGNFKMMYYHKEKMWKFREITGKASEFINGMTKCHAIEALEDRRERDELDESDNFEPYATSTRMGRNSWIPTSQFGQVQEWVTALPLPFTKRPLRGLPMVPATMERRPHFCAVDGGAVLRTFFQKENGMPTGYEMARLYILKGKEPLITRVCVDGSEYLAPWPAEWKGMEISIKELHDLNAPRYYGVPRLQALHKMILNDYHSTDGTMGLMHATSILLFPAMEKLAYVANWEFVHQVINSSAEKVRGERFCWYTKMKSIYGSDHPIKEVLGLSNKQITSLINFLDGKNDRYTKIYTVISAMKHMAYWRTQVTALDSLFGQELYWTCYTLEHMDEPERDLVFPYGTRFVQYCRRLATAMPEDMGWDTRYEMILGWTTYLKMFKTARIEPTEQDLFMHPRDIKREQKKLEEIAKAMEGENFIAACESYKDLEWENDDYFIRIPKDQADMRSEGNRMGHCVGGYVHDVIVGNSMILMFRDKKRPDKPLVTIEVIKVDGQLIMRQSFMFQNHNPSENIVKALTTWCNKKVIRPDSLNSSYHSDEEDLVAQQDEQDRKYLEKQEKILEIIRDHKITDDQTIYEKVQRLPRLNHYNYNESKDMLLELGYDVSEEKPQQLVYENEEARRERWNRLLAQPNANQIRRADDPDPLMRLDQLEDDLPF